MGARGWRKMFPLCAMSSATPPPSIDSIDTMPESVCDLAVSVPSLAATLPGGRGCLNREARKGHGDEVYGTWPFECPIQCQGPAQRIRQSRESQ